MCNKKKKKREDENMLRNGGLLLEKRISYFNGKYSNPVRTFSAKELQKATDNYNESLKTGLEGRVIFVKKYYVDYDSSYFLSPESASNEIAVEAQVSGHKNALKLLGCCLETEIPTLVFEFPMNGNLYSQLKSNPTCLPWMIRLKIVNEIASVITYLHTKFPRPIIHRDLRPEHFYLDQDFSAKLSNFMLCMTLPKGETQVESDRIMGTYVYVAPELLKYRVYSEKSDVFGFGSLLLNLLMGGRYEGVRFFEQYRRYYFGNHTINEIVDPTILAEAEATGGGVHNQFQAVFELILRCRRDNAEERPIMLDVAKQHK